jgi:hypothetical protein
MLPCPWLPLPCGPTNTEIVPKLWPLTVTSKSTGVLSSPSSRPLQVLFWPISSQTRLITVASPVLLGGLGEALGLAEGLGVGLGLAEGDGLGEALGLGLGLGSADGDGLGLGLGDALGLADGEGLGDADGDGPGPHGP